MAIIDNPELYFQTKIYTGNGVDDRDITLDGSVDMQPDLLWIKKRSATSSHRLVDSVRGSSKLLFSDQNYAEVTDTNEVQAFNSNGFQLGTDVAVNENGQTFVAWNFKAGGTASSNTDGSITSNVSANTTSGFSIVSWTGSGANATIGHGLGAEPKMIFLKIRTGTNNWQVYNKSIGSGNALFLNTTDASSSNTGWQSTDATSSVFYVSGGGAVNGSGQDLIAYCFANTSMSKMGSYTGNGSTDGTFVYTGFRPAFVIQKNTSATQGWQLQDNKRLGYNPNNYLLQPHTSQAESALQRVDLLSNGFKVRTTDAGQNASGNNYIFMAFAENPFVTSTGVPATAR